MIRWLRRWLGIEALEIQVAEMEREYVQMKVELAVYREYLAPAVVIPPGREMLLSWRTHANQ